MKNRFLTAVLLCCITASQAQHAKKALFVIVDGIAADVIEQQPTPNLDKIAKAGGYTRAHVGGDLNRWIVVKGRQ
jgi:hypothetical protein